MRALVIAASAAAFVAAPAAAQDQRFPGFRVEVNAGWDSAHADVTYSDSAFPEDDFDVDESTGGLVYGGTVGYDIPLGSGSYAGIEGSLDFADNERCEEVFGGDEACFSLNRNWAIGPRFGRRIDDASLFYAGIAYIDGRARVSYSDPAAPADDFSEAANRKGYRLSLGLEHRLAGNVFAKIEGRYLDYKNFKAEAGSERLSLGFSRYQVVTGLGMRF